MGASRTRNGHCVQVTMGKGLIVPREDRGGRGWYEHFRRRQNIYNCGRPFRSLIRHRWQRRHELVPTTEVDPDGSIVSVDSSFRTPLKAIQ